MMLEFLSDLTDASVALVAAYPIAALAVAFAAAIIEAVAVLGILVPGTPILMATAGAAAMAGHSMVPYVILSILGAVIGDYVSFWVGHRYSGRLRQLWPFASRPQLMDGATAFFKRYGFYSVALCRFVPVFRSTVPLVAGMAHMERRRFLIANITSAFVWAPAHIYPAQMAGLSIDSLRRGEWQTALLWGVVFGLCFAAGWFVHHVVIRKRRRA